MMSWATRFSCLWIAVVILSTAGTSAEEEGNASTERLVLRDGVELSGQSWEIDFGHIFWELPDGELLPIPLEDVERLDFGPHRDDFLDPESTVLTDPDVVLGEKATAPWSDLVPVFPQIQQTYGMASETAARWTQRLQIGGTSNEGNTRTSLVDVAAVFEQNTEDKMRQIDAGGQWARNATTQTANRWWANTNFDWPVYQQWITFITSKNEYNQPAHLNYRGTVSSGIGYRFVFEERKRLIVRIGPAYTLEIFRSPSNTRNTPDMFGEIELRWPILERTTLEQKTRVQPNMLDAELVRVFSTTGVVVDLDGQDRWKFRLGLQYQFNSEPNPGLVPSDYLTTMSLVYQRK